MSLQQPVQYPVKYYSHLDTGAPQIANVDGNIKAILKACLVTGYGAKAGAGWTALFDDTYRIVLRRPLRTGNPPDIKIENGVINGTASHRIVSQDNPASLDDTVELASVNLLARDTRIGSEWHLIVSDFGFILCYQIGEYGVTGDRNSVLFCGSAQSMQDNAFDSFIVNTDSRVSRNGQGSTYLAGLLYINTGGYSNDFKNMRNGAIITDKAYLTLTGNELALNSEYTAQPIIIGNNLIPPFYCSAFAGYADLLATTVNINDRPMLRYVNKPNRTYGDRPLYIPLDYWEL